jgi:hypothetical protein
MKRLADMFAAERESLEGQWDRGDNGSTEGLRLCAAAGGFLAAGDNVQVTVTAEPTDAAEAIGKCQTKNGSKHLQTAEK